MDKFLEFIVDNIFTFIFIVLGGLFIYAMFMVAEAGNVSRENTRKLTEVCYAQGMVLVDTDAGQRCVLPQSLVKVK